MPAKKPSDETKVMDISKPGKGKVVANSRPVVAPIVSSPSKKTANAEAAASDSANDVAPKAPSVSRKVIRPLNDIKLDEPTSEDSLNDEIKATLNLPDTEIKIASDDPSVTATLAKTGTQEPNPVKEEIPVVKKSENKPEEVGSVPQGVAGALEENAPTNNESVADESEVGVEAQSSTSDTVANTPAADSPSPQDVSSENAEVNALAQKVTAKKEAAKKAEEQAKRDAELQELINSKKYFVPIKHGSSHNRRRGKAALLVLLFVLILAAAVYSAIDAEIFDLGLELPYEFIK